ncbi:hypothetical protein ACHWQZ_G010265 [Mnemiopsis leidyi]
MSLTRGRRKGGRRGRGGGSGGGGGGGGGSGGGGGGGGGSEEVVEVKGENKEEMTDARTINTYDRGSLIETNSSEREIQQVLVPRRLAVSCPQLTPPYLQVSGIVPPTNSPLSAG